MASLLFTLFFREELLIFFIFLVSSLTKPCLFLLLLSDLLLISFLLLNLKKNISYIYFVSIFEFTVGTFTDVLFTVFLIIFSVL